MHFFCQCRGEVNRNYRNENSTGQELSRGKRVFKKCFPVMPFALLACDFESGIDELRCVYVYNAKCAVMQMNVSHD